MVKVSDNETVIQRAIRLIKEFDREAHITIVTGFCGDSIKSSLSNEYNFITNPFYKVTNSVASLWFARNVLKGNKPVVILNSDIVFSVDFAKEITSIPKNSTIYYDSSIQSHGDYNVQALNGKMVVMGKELSVYDGEYVGITKYVPEDLPALYAEVDKLVTEGLYDQWYENGLVQMTLNGEKLFQVTDAADFQWSEIDSIDNLLKIRRIINAEKQWMN